MCDKCVQGSRWCVRVRERVFARVLEVPVVRAVSAVSMVLMALSLTGCTGAIWGNLVVLGITVGIFFGTLTLGRSGGAPSAEASSSTQSSRRG